MRDTLLKEIGVGQDPITNAVSTSNEWWQEKIKVKKTYDSVITVLGFTQRQRPLLTVISMTHAFTTYEGHVF